LIIYQDTGRLAMIKLETYMHTSTFSTYVNSVSDAYHIRFYTPQMGVGM
jgi:hypothetical protein